ncbi:MAG: hypothetical protein ACSHXL_00890 [Bacteroidota bacterium]
MLNNKTYLNNGLSLNLWAKTLFEKYADDIEDKKLVFVSSQNVTGAYGRLGKYRLIVYILDFIRSVKRQLELYNLQYSDKKIIAVDLHDNLGLSKYDLKLLRASTLYFKRELAINPWGNLSIAHANIRHPGFFRRGSKLWAEDIEKLRPISLGVKKSETLKEVNWEAKSIDVFYAGDSRDVPSRIMAEQVCTSLKAMGLKVDNPKERLSKKDFLERLEKSWICLSPIGNGWDCFRHYEAAGNYSLPIMEYPSINLPHSIPIDSNVCFSDYSEKLLVEQIQNLLKDKNKLKQSILELVRWVDSNHTDHAIAEYVISQINQHLSPS